MNRRAVALAFFIAAGAVGGTAVLLRHDRGRGPTELPPPPGTAAPPAGSAAPAPAGAAPTAGAEVTPEVTTVKGDDAFRLLVFRVPVAGARFRVVDLGMTRDLERVLRETGASLVVNGGFFDPAQRPEGLVVSEGAVVSARSDALGGGVVAVANVVTAPSGRTR